MDVILRPRTTPTRRNRILLGLSAPLTSYLHYGLRALPALCFLLESLPLAIAFLVLRHRRFTPTASVLSGSHDLSVRDRIYWQSGHRRVVAFSGFVVQV